jgi:hypothetical protein
MLVVREYPLTANGFDSLGSNERDKQQTAHAVLDCVVVAGNLSLH